MLSAYPQMAQKKDLSPIARVRTGTHTHTHSHLHTQFCNYVEEYDLVLRTHILKYLGAKCHNV